MRMNFVDVVAYLLLILGGINWALSRLFNYNLLDNIFGADSMVVKILYGLVGLAAVWGLINLLRNASRAERAEHAERMSGHEMDREDRTHPAGRTEPVERADYGTTSRRGDRRTGSRNRRR